MKNTILLVAILISTLSFSQMRVVSLHSSTNGVQYFSETQSNFQPFVLAYAAAIDGDTIYVGGGNYDVPALFNKRLTIYGTGHYPTATTETLRSQFNSNINFGDNADGTSIEGIFLNASIIFNDVPTHNIVIKRCLIEGGVFATGTSGNYGNNCLFSENIIRGSLDLNNLRSCQFNNNMIFGTLNNATNHIFINNNFMAFQLGYWDNHWAINYANACVFNNNIFVRNNDLLCANGTNVWNNNFFNGNPILGINPIVSNSVLIDPTLVFINYTTNTNFSYTQDYHLKATALTHLGTDGTQRGVYGGAAPFKEQAIPVNPHISSAIISPQSNAGQINVNIQAQAQSR